MWKLFTLMAALMLAAALMVTAANALVLDDGDGDGVTFETALTGDQEVPPVVTDTSGFFRIEFNEDFTKAEFRLDVFDGVRVTQAHIHCGEAGVNGPVVAFLAGNNPTGWDVDGRWIDNATLTDANIVNASCGDTLLELAMSMAAGLMYANVHTLAHPGGEIRGQLGGDDDDDDDDDEDDDGGDDDDDISGSDRRAAW